MPLRLQPKLDQDDSDLPAPAQLAFAFSIIRSKPPHLSVEEYLESLRTAIVTQSTWNLGALKFDAAMYWKASYQKAEAERLRLLNEVSRLENEQDSLRSRHESRKTKTSTTTGKRSRNTMVPPANKKNKHDQILDLEDDDLDFGVDGVTLPWTDRHSFLRGVFGLRRNLLPDEPDQDALVNAIQAACASVSNILRNDMATTQRPQTEPETQSIVALGAVFKRVYPSVLSSLKYVQPQTGDESDQCFPGLSSVVNVFQGFLGWLHKLALDEFTRQEKDIKRKNRRPGARVGAVAGQKHSYTGPQDLANVGEITQTLVVMIISLDVSCDAHCELLEGYLCALLDHMGSSLSLLVFSDAERPHQGQTAGILPPSGLVDTLHLNHETAAGTATIEGPYLIFVLRKAVKFVLANAKRMSSKSLAIFTLQEVDHDDADPGDTIGRQIQKTLQNTLLRGAFGDEDDTFYDSLRRDEGGEDVELKTTVGKIRQGEDPAEWFIGELWEHLGWNILSGQRGH